MKPHRSLPRLWSSQITFLITCGWLAVHALKGEQVESSPANFNFVEMRDSLGSFGETRADFNGDGVVNVLDLAMFKLRELVPPSFTVAEGLEQILVSPATSIVGPGDTISVFFLIRNNTTPILGYSLDVQVIPKLGAIGSVAADVTATNFFDDRNLITAAGETRDPFFSLIQDGGNGGIFINTITEDNSTVVAVDNVNDVLAEVFIQVSSDACGDFELVLGAASALSDGNAIAIPYSYTNGIVRLPTNRFGDVTPPGGNGLVNLDDILCVLAGFSSVANCLDGDIQPCGGNGVINLDDILGVLAAFAGANTCPSGCS